MWLVTCQKRKGQGRSELHDEGYAGEETHLRSSPCFAFARHWGGFLPWWLSVPVPSSYSLHAYPTTHHTAVNTLVSRWCTCWGENSASLMLPLLQLTLQRCPALYSCSLLALPHTVPGNRGLFQWDGNIILLPWLPHGRNHVILSPFLVFGNFRQHNINIDVYRKIEDGHLNSCS